jgi:uncharacterized protein YdhG (YjbR/CyaY superfamily)
VLGIFSAITTKYPKLELVIAWNQPMLKFEGQYVFGVSVLKNYLLIAPMSGDVLEAFSTRLASFKVNKQTIRVPLDWKVNATLVRALAGARLAEIRG